MKKFLREFFSISNEINENIVMGVIFSILFLGVTFTNIDVEKYYTIAGMITLFFGVGALKRWYAKKLYLYYS